MEKYKNLIEQLKNGEINTIEISKEEFLLFREILVKDELFKHFHGEGKQGGNVVYTFMETPRA
ncbi:hypothetical protein [Ureibacillus manganicus]|uniref:Abortive phage infection protein n=1 Tax=Ureibacillus manganicus DSM 26584 TaxID=1384049 RepID=A0A0A3ICH8_9BACL|nr:hypothetical protein [Ureibacillus manganicus]KGR80528.1 hypothetical protein CD29_01150 [Ureibacillus manganicus DSM 26584]